MLVLLAATFLAGCQMISDSPSRATAPPAALFSVASPDTTSAGIRNGCNRPTRWWYSSNAASSIAKSDPRSVAKTESSSSGCSTAANAARIEALFGELR